MQSKLVQGARALPMLICASVLLAAAPALTLAIPKWLVYGHDLELGMHRTAFSHFQATFSAALVFPLVFLGLLLAFTALSTFVFRDEARAERFLRYAVATILAVSFPLTLYWLDKSDWCPNFWSARGLALNGLAALIYLAIGSVLFLRSLRRQVAATLFVASLLIGTTAYANYLAARTPVMFEDVSLTAGLRELDNSLGVAFGDYDGDGWQDLFVSNHLPAKTRSWLYRNVRGKFSRPRPLAAGDLHGAAWADFDNDGWAELFVAGGNDTPKGPAYPNYLFRGKRGEFADVARAAGVQETAGRAWGAAPADYDGDGLLDLYVVNYFTAGALFRNAGDGTFSERAREAGLARAAPGEPTAAGTLCASWADYDRDRDMDLLTVSIGTGIALHRNDGQGSFSEVARAAGLVSDIPLGTEQDPRGPSGCAWGDYDNDGDLDLYVSMMSGNDGRNLLFANQGDGHFREVGAQARVDSKSFSRAALWADFDNDGDLDLYLVNEVTERGDIGNPQHAIGWNELHMNAGDGTFVQADADASGAAGFPYVHEGTAALADFDNDGFVDIYINNQRPLPGRERYLRQNLLLRNQGNDNHWLELRLRGTASNSDGIGAKVTLSAGGKRQYRERGTETHTFAQNSPVLHFGLGTATVVDTVSIEWPSGAVQTLTQVAPDQILTVTEPAEGSS